MATARVPSASFNLAFFGATTRATLKVGVAYQSGRCGLELCMTTHDSYLSMAQTHLHNPSAAVEAFLIFTGSNSGFEVYSFLILAIRVGLMLSYRQHVHSAYDML